MRSDARLKVPNIPISHSPQNWRGDFGQACRCLMQACWRRFSRAGEMAKEPRMKNCSGSFEVRNFLLRSAGSRVHTTAALFPDRPSGNPGIEIYDAIELARRLTSDVAGQSEHALPAIAHC